MQQPNWLTHSLPWPCSLRLKPSLLTRNSSPVNKIPKKSKKIGISEFFLKIKLAQPQFKQKPPFLKQKPQFIGPYCEFLSG